MSELRVLTAAEQVAAYLRECLMRGMWSGRMPGGDRLAVELGVGRNTIETALQELEAEGLLEPQGAGRRRRILLPEVVRERRQLRIAILVHEPLALTEGYMVELQHVLQQAGHDAIFADRTLVELKMDVRRVARRVRQIHADVWVVESASSEVLSWFAEQGIHVFALFGRRRGLPIAGVGPDKVGTYREIVRRLVALGHRRIVLLALKSRRLPVPGASERAFLEEIAAQGISTSHYNLPDWTASPEGLQQVLDSLFRVTPPTALLLDEAYLFHAVKDHLSRRGIEAPEDVSLICSDPDRTFVWCQPSVAHIAWDSRPVVRRIERWANNVSRGKTDLRQTLTPARLIEGGTIGPAKEW